MKFKRASGIILHPTSLPGPDGIGDLGPEAYHWIDFLADTGTMLWQILPLGPTGYGDSPYQSFSAFAGNPLLVSPAILLDQDLLIPRDLADRPSFSNDHVDYGAVIPWKLTVLDRAYDRFLENHDRSLKGEFDRFVESNADWLEDYALFMAIKGEQNGVAWNQWPAGLRTRNNRILEVFKSEHEDAIGRHTFRQFLFYQQWNALHEYARSKGILVIGDIPIFVAYDSAEAWSHSELFFMDKQGNLTVVAGVPPDYFSPTGQLWGNPLYRWNVHEQSGYRWWIDRLRSTFKQVDIIRLDHFRGFAGYWEIPAGNETAEIGRWVSGPGSSFFNAVQRQLVELPIIAEDLGEITPDVVALREKYNLPGMKILQFAFSTDATDPFLPHNFPANCVVYTGTHDNDTTLGWYHTAPDEERDFCRRYLARSGDDISWDFIRAAWGSVACMALAPLQDFFSLGTEARMNFPGHPSGNWTWRMRSNDLNDFFQNRLKEANILYGRTPELQAEKIKGHV